MLRKEKLQEDEYSFPYHHLVEIKPFSEAKHLFWGLEYATYLARVAEIITGEAPASLVDIGCGDGKFLAELRKRLPEARLVGSDYSEQAISLARLLVSGVEFAAKLPDGERFEAFTSIEVVEHITPEALPDFAAYCAALVEEGGLGVITTPSINAPLQEKHYQHFTPESLSASFKMHFEIVRIEWLNARTWRAKLAQRLLANRFFILNYPPLTQKIFRWYMRVCARADAMTGGRLLLIVKKKPASRMN